MFSTISKRINNRPASFVYTIAAQQDNLGDIAIRLRMLDWLRQTDNEVFIYVGPMSEGYLEAFDLDERVTVLKTKTEVIRTVLSLWFRRRVFIIFAPGPSIFGGWKNSLRTVINVAVVSFVSVGGGGAAHIGASYRRGGNGGEKLQKLLLSLLKLCIVRDEKSVISKNALLYPDLAFDGSDLPETSKRFRLTVSLRSDYQVSDSLLDDCRAISEKNGWKLTFVSQVERDDMGHREKAEAYEADYIGWEGGQVNQSSRVKNAYEESVAVITDRLHALIFSMNAGALPVALVHDGNDKLTSSFKHVWAIPQVNSNQEYLGESTLKVILAHASDSSDQTGTFKEIDRAIMDVKRKFLKIFS